MQLEMLFGLPRAKGRRSPVCRSFRKDVIPTAGNPSMYPASEIGNEGMYIMMIAGGGINNTKLNVATVNVALLSQLKHRTARISKKCSHVVYNFRAKLVL